MAYFVEEKRRGKGFKMGSIEGGGLGEEHWWDGGAALFILHLNGVTCQPFLKQHFSFLGLICSAGEHMGCVSWKYSHVSH